MLVAAKYLCVLSCVLLVAWAQKCSMQPTDPQYENYRNNSARIVPGWHVVNLDLPPEQRWGDIVKPHTEQIKTMINAYKSQYGQTVEELLDLAEKAFGGIGSKLLEKMPPEYAGELAGIAAATGISAIDLWVYNIMYELSGACTGIVAQTPSGQIVHGRNLDFGGGGPLTAALRPLLFNVRFVKGGKVLFNSTSYAGYVGCLTCMKQGSFSVTVNTRFWSASPSHVPVELAEWILGLRKNAHFLTFMTRDAMEQDLTFAEAVRRANSTELLGPAYVILGGVQAGEGAVITREPRESLHFWSLADEVSTSDQRWILETNYDHWDGQPRARRDNGNACMKQIVSVGKVNFAGLFSVLSSAPTGNAETTYTTLMSAHDGTYEAYIQTELKTPPPDAVARDLIV